MAKTEYIGFRASEEQRQKLETLASANQASMSWVLGLLLDQATQVAPTLFMGGSHSAEMAQAGQRQGEAVAHG